MGRHDPVLGLDIRRGGRSGRAGRTFHGVIKDHLERHALRIGERALALDHAVQIQLVKAVSAVGRGQRQAVVMPHARGDGADDTNPGPGGVVHVLPDIAAALVAFEFGDVNFRRPGPGAVQPEGRPAAGRARIGRIDIHVQGHEVVAAARHVGIGINHARLIVVAILRDVIRRQGQHIIAHGHTGLAVGIGDGIVFRPVVRVRSPRQFANVHKRVGREAGGNGVGKRGHAEVIDEISFLVGAQIHELRAEVVFPGEIAADDIVAVHNDRHIDRRAGRPRGEFVVYLHRVVGPGRGPISAGVKDAVTVRLHLAIVGNEDARGRVGAGGQQGVLQAVNIVRVGARREINPVAGVGILGGPVESHRHAARVGDGRAAWVVRPVPQLGVVGDGVKTHARRIAGAIAAARNKFQLIAADLLFDGGGLGDDPVGVNPIGAARQAGRVQVSVGNIVVVGKNHGGGAGGQAASEDAGCNHTTDEGYGELEVSVHHSRSLRYNNAIAAGWRQLFDMALHASSLPLEFV